ncbi:MAG: hypothetical protein ACU0FH_16430 [Heliomarina sp.]
MAGRSFDKLKDWARPLTVSLSTTLPKADLARLRAPIDILKMSRT